MKNIGYTLAIMAALLFFSWLAFALPVSEEKYSSLFMYDTTSGDELEFTRDWMLNPDPENLEVTVSTTLSHLGAGILQTDANGVVSAAAGPQFDLIQFNTSYAGSTAVGQLNWNSTDGTLEFGLPGGVVVLQIGQEQVILARNNTGSTITNGSVVYISGATGNKPTIALADPSAEASSNVIGIATEDIENNASRYVTTFGLVRELNTNGLGEGSMIYLSTTPGAFTTTMPAAPNFNVPLGIILRDHPTDGMVFISVDVRPRLTDLSDVEHVVPTVAGQFVRWDTVDARYELGLFDHGALTGLTPDDDHTQYAKIAGQTFTGGVTVEGVFLVENAATVEGGFIGESAGVFWDSLTANVNQAGGDLAVTLDAGGNAFSVDGATGDTIVVGDLTVDGGTLFVDSAAATVTAGGPILGDSGGTAGAPSICPNSADPDTGITSISGNTLEFNTSGVSRYSMNNTLFFGKSGSFAMPSIAGTEAAPTYAFNDDPDTGAFRDTADQYEIVAGGTSRVFIDATGLGVGTVAGTALHVDSSAANTTAIETVENTAGDYQVFRTDATPEGAVTGSIGDFANDTTGGDFYYKETGSASNTGWDKVVLESNELFDINHAELSVKGSVATVTLTNQDQYYQVTQFIDDGESVGSTPDPTEDHITIGEDGVYLVNISVSFFTDTNNSIIDFQVFKNNGTSAFTNMHAHRKLGTGADIGNVGLTGLLDLEENDTLELWAESTAGGAGIDLTVEDANFNIVKIN